MEKYSFLTIWLLVFIIYGPCSKGIAKNVQTNPLHKPEGNIVENQRPDRDIALKNMVVANKTNSAYAHKVIKRQSGLVPADPPPELNVLEERRTNAISAVENYIAEYNTTEHSWQNMFRNDLQGREQQDERNLEEDEQFLMAGGPQEIVDERRLRRNAWWEAYWTNQQELYTRFREVSARELMNLQIARDEAVQDIVQFRRHHGEL